MIRAVSLLGLTLLIRQACAQIKVMTPPKLVSDLGDNGRVPGSTATFGAPFYGDTVLGRLVYGESKNDNLHCTEDDYDLPPEGDAGRDEHEHFAGAAQLIRIVVVRRGKCSFTKKVRVAFDKGAHAVIIVDKENSGLTREGLQNIIVADDGYGGNIKIPSVLITHADGEKLINFLKVPEKTAVGNVVGEKNKAPVDYQEVLVELAWDIPSDHVVRVDKWMSTGSTESMLFMKEFAAKRRVLNEVMMFTPHFNVFSLETGHLGIFNKLCWDEKNGTFCTEDPDGPGPITGRDVLEEDLRLLCIHETYKKVGQHKKNFMTVWYAAEFWYYIEKFADRCPISEEKNPAKRFSKECATQLMKDVKIDPVAVQKCITTTAEEKLTEQLFYRAWSPRAMRINGWRYTGMLSADLVVRAICEGFIEKPKECAWLINPRDPTKPYQSAPSSSFSFGKLLVWLCVFALVGAGLLWLYKNYMQKEMRSSIREEVMLAVQSQMGEYKRMNG